MKRGQSHGRAEYPGSQLYIQDLVNDNPEYLNQLIFSSSISLATYARQQPEWVSPLLKEDYKEYRDEWFLWPIDQAVHYKKHKEFWPTGGPQWDALAAVKGKDGTNGVILVEAKANTLELGGPHYACRAESTENRNKIERSLATVKEVLGVRPAADWMGDYYQYANRLAHLYFLYTLCQVPTWLVFVYFVGGEKTSSLSTAEGWHDDLIKIRETLGLPKNHMLTQRVINIFPKVSSQLNGTE